MNWANRITLFRIILIPAIIILMLFYNFGDVTGFYPIINKLIIFGNYQLSLSYLIAGILFIVASLTDALDGYVARKYKLVTTFGKFFDAIADKLLTNTVLIMFTISNIIPVWMCIVLICRDFLIDVVRQILATSSVVMSANSLGKYRATFEMIGLSMMFFVGHRMFEGTSSMYGEFGWLNQILMIPMYIATILSVVSAINYIYLNRKVLLNTDVEKKANVKDNNEGKNDEKKTK